MRSFAASLITLAVLFFWDKDYNNGRMLDGLDIARGLTPRKCLRYLTRNPFAVGFAVTLIQTRSLRSSRTMTKA
jgi:hypothetical protein